MHSACASRTCDRPKARACRYLALPMPGPCPAPGAPMAHTIDYQDNKRGSPAAFSAPLIETGPMAFSWPARGFQLVCRRPAGAARGLPRGAARSLITQGLPAASRVAQSLLMAEPCQGSGLHAAQPSPCNRAAQGTPMGCPWPSQRLPEACPRGPRGVSKCYTRLTHCLRLWRRATHDKPAVYFPKQARRLLMAPLPMDRLWSSHALSMRVP